MNAKYFKHTKESLMIINQFICFVNVIFFGSNNRIPPKGLNNNNNNKLWKDPLKA